MSNHITWTRLPNDRWGIRVQGDVPVRSGDTVVVVKRNGMPSEGVLGRLVSKTGDVSIYEQSTFTQKRR